MPDSCLCCWNLIIGCNGLGFYLDKEQNSKVQQVFAGQFWGLLLTWSGFWAAISFQMCQDVKEGLVKILSGVNWLLWWHTGSPQGSFLSLGSGLLWATAGSKPDQMGQDSSQPDFAFLELFATRLVAIRYESNQTYFRQIIVFVNQAFTVQLRCPCPEQLGGGSCRYFGCNRSRMWSVHTSVYRVATRSLLHKSCPLWRLGVVRDKILQGEVLVPVPEISNHSARKYMFLRWKKTHYLFWTVHLLGLHCSLIAFQHQNRTFSTTKKMKVSQRLSEQLLSISQVIKTKHTNRTFLMYQVSFSEIQSLGDVQGQILRLFEEAEWMVSLSLAMAPAELCEHDHPNLVQRFNAFSFSSDSAAFNPSQLPIPSIMLSFQWNFVAVPIVNPTIYCTLDRNSFSSAIILQNRESENVFAAWIIQKNVFKLCASNILLLRAFKNLSISLSSVFKKFPVACRCPASHPNFLSTVVYQGTFFGFCALDNFFFGWAASDSHWPKPRETEGNSEGIFDKRAWKVLLQNLNWEHLEKLLFSMVWGQKVCLLIGAQLKFRSVD